MILCRYTMFFPRIVQCIFMIQYTITYKMISCKIKFHHCWKKFISNAGTTFTYGIFIIRLNICR